MTRDTRRLDHQESCSLPGCEHTPALRDYQEDGDFRCDCHHSRNRGREVACG